MLYDSAVELMRHGHRLVAVISSKEAPEYKRTVEDFESLARSNGVPFFRTTRISNIVDQLLQLGPIDIGISMNYPGIIGSEVIDLFRCGILNAHGGDLPRYRGNACQAWAILNGETRIGLCVHKMIGGELDSGDIITRAYMPIEPNTKVTAAWAWMESQVPALMREAVDQLAEDSEYVLERQSKNRRDALRCYPRRPEDGRIDWTYSALQTLRLINASNKPYPGAFCEFEGNRMTIWDAELSDDDEQFLAVPGQVTLISETYIDVACGEGKLRINTVQIADQPECAPTTFVTSSRQRLL